jgi:hypothetical protein
VAREDALGRGQDALALVAGLLVRR